MSKSIYSIALIAVMMVAFHPVSLFAETKDTCSEGGIIVRNMTMLDRWYKKNDGACTIWRHNHMFTSKPEDKFEIFSDLACKTSYCAGNPAYTDYKSVDANGDCRVRILPDCNLSDM
jgi:hypothetical protein